MPHLENWTLRRIPFLNMTTEFHKGCFLHGDASGHVLIGEGTVNTSPLVEFDPVNKTATTLTGSNYTLGEPSPAYAEFMKEHGHVQETT